MEFISFKDFINEAKTSKEEAKDLTNYFKVAVAAKNVDITTKFKYQPFDKEYFFEFNISTNSYRLFYDAKRAAVFMLDIKSGEEYPINTPQEFETLLKTNI